MKGSIRICRLFGIGVYVHWTFLLLLGWIVYIAVSRGGGAADALWAIVFVIAVFACIVMHELGHALTARRFGIHTRDITLLPIGGLARLERMPEDPYQELLVAVGGPAVTLVLAVLFGGATVLVTGTGSLIHVDFLGGNLLAKLAWVNGLLLAFNMLPAFPMDGGRVLRALLHFWLPYVQATQIASAIGQSLAIFMGVVGLALLHPFLILIAVFVYFGARAEARSAQARGLCRGVPVRSAMITHFRALRGDDPLGIAADELLAGAQQDFPVVEGSEVAGVLLRADLFRAITARGHDVPVSEVMRRNCPAVEETASLELTLMTMRENDCPTLPVMRRGELVGIITLENVGEWMMLQSTGPGRSV